MQLVMPLYTIEEQLKGLSWLHWVAFYNLTARGFGDSEAFAQARNIRSMLQLNALLAILSTPEEDVYGTKTC